MPTSVHVTLHFLLLPSQSQRPACVNAAGERACVKGVVELRAKPAVTLVVKVNNPRRAKV